MSEIEIKENQIWDRKKGLRGFRPKQIRILRVLSGGEAFEIAIGDGTIQQQLTRNEVLSYYELKK